jgi:H+/Cl- antiporter ClcA
MSFITRTRQFWRYWHVRLAAIFAVLSGAVVSEPNILGGLVPYVPPYWRPAAGAIVGVIVFALPTYLKRGKRAANG